MKGQVGVMGVIIAVVTFVILLPVVNNILRPTYTLNNIVNDSVLFTDEGAVSRGQTTYYPINGQLTQCANATAVLTVPTQCNVSTALNGTVQAVDTLSNGATLNLIYAAQDATYLTNSTERSIASNIFIFVLIGLFILAGSFAVMKGGV